MTQTLRALDTQQLAHTGRPGEITYQQVGDIRVALVGFAPYPWAQRLEKIVPRDGSSRRPRQTLMSSSSTMHAGAEGTSHAHVKRGTETFLGENRGNSIAFTHAVVEAGADLVVGSGPHVLRGMEWYTAG